ncbi:tyrosine-type recombinase/integrase [Acidithiobacillus thiooxidans]|uniref:tyrosine-type recombinase/integrase n=1 Tax=Acidithiobacillus thiooxidans TaxID=930 RepID=UPI001C06CC27|nr:integrase family protein [Acidithiobacillus thiooxidans]MBU2837607.1 tyrosine-type recombinase/integrase [Acidithiobacillus thiooxidans]
MERIRLSKRAIDTFPLRQEGESPLFYRDRDLVGFGLKVTSQNKVFIVEKRVNGKPKRVTIGTYGAPWTPENARNKAQQLLAVMAEGDLPTEIKRQERQRAVSLDEVFQQYIQIRTLTPKTVTEYRRALNLYLANWKNEPITSITRERVSERFRDISSENGHATANAVMRGLRALLNFAQHQYGTEQRPLFRENPVQILSHTRAWHRISRRQNCLRPADFAPWLAAVRGLPNATMRDYLLFLLFTGMRREEAASLTWAQVDFANRMVKVTDTKNHDPLELPLPSVLLEMLHQRKQQSDPDCRYVFPGDGRHGYVQEPRKALEAVKRITGITAMPHDLRRTFMTVADSLEISPYALKRLVNHRRDQSDVTAGYIVSGVERLREPMERIAQAILSHGQQ